MVAFGLGEMPGLDIAAAADVIAGESPLVFVPQLPARGIGSDAIGRTLAVVPDLPCDARTRTWVLQARPQRSTRRTWDRLEADLDTCQEIWPHLDSLKFQVVGPWTLAAQIELSNGHRAVTDTGALRDITEALIFGIREHCEDLRRRFDCPLVLQLDEPSLALLASGTLTGTSEFDEIAAIAAPELGARLAGVFESIGDAAQCRLNLSETVPLWEVVRTSGAPAVSVNIEQLRGTEQLDALGEALSAGTRVGIGITRPGERIDSALERPRGYAQRIARLFDELGIDRQNLISHVDVHPIGGLAKASLLDAAAALAMARTIAEMLLRDAGDL